MHDHDRNWIDEQIKKLPLHLRDKIRSKYNQVWQENYDNEPLPHRKDCIARRAANLRLLDYIENWEKYGRGRVSVPPKMKAP